MNIIKFVEKAEHNMWTVEDSDGENIKFYEILQHL